MLSPVYCNSLVMLATATWLAPKGDAQLCAGPGMHVSHFLNFYGTLLQKYQAGLSQVAARTGSSMFSRYPRQGQIAAC